MFNLLPDKEKRELVRAYNIRRASITLMAFAVVCFWAIGTLLPSYLHINSLQTDIAERNTTALIHLQGDRAMTLNTFANNLNQKANLLQRDNKVPTLSDVIDSISTLKTFGIHITGIQYGQEKNNQALTLIGFADSRKSLVEFKQNLQNSNLFESIDLPVSNLAKDTNVGFNINAVMKKTL